LVTGCVAAHPSDLAVAFAALGAVVRTAGRTKRVIPMTELHRLPDREAERDTVLRHGERIRPWIFRRSPSRRTPGGTRQGRARAEGHGRTSDTSGSP
jgi:CO/xanthine dehydrogenase FAD-binding subunit